jgi:hypothetical protein
VEGVINRNIALHDCQANKQLQDDLIDHIWQKFGHTYRTDK